MHVHFRPSLRTPALQRVSRKVRNRRCVAASALGHSCALDAAHAHSRAAAAMKGFAEQCMSEYDLNGWTVPDLVDNTEVRLFDTKAD